MSYARTVGNARTKTTYSSKSSTPKVAKHSSNQPALDRLQKELERVASGKAENYVQALYKAIKSLAACKEPITTYKQAMELKYVGQRCAGFICPPSQLGDGGQATKTAKPASRARKKRKEAATKDGEEKQDSISDSDSPLARATKKKGTNPNNEASTKERAYQATKQESISKWTHPIPYTSRTDAAHGLQWKVLLLIDNREPNYEKVLSKCQQSGIPAEERTLPIGDMVWVAQGLRQHTIGSTTTTVLEAELLLGTIIERKTTDDLVSSFLGTRYAEQRLRLQHSGQPQILFLIEGNIHQQTWVSAFPKERLQMAIMETRVELGFQILHTEHFADTILNLKRIHRRILQRSFPQAFGLANNNPRSARRSRRPTSLVEMVLETPPTPSFGQGRFQTYDELKTKIERDREAGTKTVGALHAAMLRQLCGTKQAVAIRQQYPTPSALLSAYDRVEEGKEQDDLVKDCSLDNGNQGNRRVGPKVAKDVAFAYCFVPGDSTTTGSPNAGVKPAARQSSPTATFTTTIQQNSYTATSKRPSPSRTNTATEPNNKRRKSSEELMSAAGRAALDRFEATSKPKSASPGCAEGTNGCLNNQVDNRRTDINHRLANMPAKQTNDNQWSKPSKSATTTTRTETTTSKPRHKAASNAKQSKSLDCVDLLSSDEEEEEEQIVMPSTTKSSKPHGKGPNGCRVPVEPPKIKPKPAAVNSSLVLLDDSSDESSDEDEQGTISESVTKNCQKKPPTRVVSGDTVDDAIEVD